MMKDNASATAALVLKALIFAAGSEKHGGLVSPEAIGLSDRIARTALKFPRPFFVTVRVRFFRWILEKIEQHLNPGFIFHVAARKNFIDQLAQKSIEAGCNQVVMLGAGYDTLCIRLATSFPEIACIEIDHPATQRVKETAISGCGLPPNLFLVPADLSVRSVSEVLRDIRAFDAKKKTLIVIEGVLMYLDEQTVKKLLKELLGLFPNGLSVVFTFMDRQPSGNIQFHTAHPLVNWWLRQKEEQFLWGIERTNLPSYLESIGFSHAEVFGKREFETTLFQGPKKPPRLAEGENICLATQ